MRSCAINLTLGCCLVFLNLVQAQNTVECKPDPPGGTVTCEKDQIACCIVKNGRVTSKCIDVPDDDSAMVRVTSDDLATGIMMEIYDGQNPGWLSNPKHLLFQGYWVSPFGETCRVKIPDKILRRLKK